MVQVCWSSNIVSYIQGETAIADEVERLIEGKCRLQQTNLKLEAQNLELKMQLEKRRLTELTPRDSQ